MAVYKLTKDAILRLSDISYAEAGFKEREDIQRLLRSYVDVISPDTLIIAEEFCEWSESRRRIDLLGIDHEANLVVIELKRHEDGAHMELQAIRYAAMVSRMSFNRAVEVFQDRLEVQGAGKDARKLLLEFLGWEEPRNEDFARDVRLVLVAADFSKELTTSVLWLSEFGMDIRCVRLKPYAIDDQIVVDAQQILPLPEAEDYQIGIREKASSRREAARQEGEPTGYWFMNVGDRVDDGRSWEDCRKYGFMLAGGDPLWINKVKRLRVGDPLFAYASGSGYVGFGEVLEEAVSLRDFVPPAQNKRLRDLPVKTRHSEERINDPARCDWCVAVKWHTTFAREDGVLRSRSRRGTLEQIRTPNLVNDLLREFGAQTHASRMVREASDD